MAIRFWSSMIGLPFLIFFVTYAGWPLKLSIAIVSLIGMREFYSAIFKKINSIQFVGYFFGLLYCLFMEDIFRHYLGIFSVALLMSALLILVIRYPRYNILDGAITLIGFYYVCFLISYICLVRYQPSGVFFVWLIFICSWGSDTGAYFAGRMFGKHKLSPLLSPKKTVEGAVGGVLSAILIASAYGFFYYKFFAVEKDSSIILLSAIIGAAGSILSQFGDLAASAIKRYTGVKDFGNLIPGHGGFLDRFDSVLFTAPIVYYVSLFF